MNIIKKINTKNVKVNLLKIDEVKTEQNLTIFNKSLPSFTQLLNKSKYYQDKTFFIN